MTTKVNQIPATRVVDWVFARLDKLRRDRYEDHLAPAVRFALEDYFGRVAPDDAAPVPTDEQAELKRRKTVAEVEARELELAKIRGDVSSRADFIAELEPRLANARQEIMNLPSAVDGMTDEQRKQLDGAIQNLLTTLSGAADADGSL